MAGASADPTLNVSASAGTTPRIQYQVGKPKLLFVDDDESIRQTLPAILAAEGFDCICVATVSEAISQISLQPFEVLLSDLNIGQPGDGFTVVSAMRRIQPQARTFILTGYPDFASALEAVRSQVDDYLVKPVNIPTLVKALKTEAPRPRGPGSGGKRASTVIQENTATIIERCYQEIERNPQFARLDLPKSERIDHLPGVLRQLVNRIDRNPEFSDKQDVDSAWAHGVTRRRQGYSVPMIVEEAGVLYRVITDILHANLLDMDMSFLIPDLYQISDSLNVMLAESLRSFLAGEQIAA
jgi:ActR/RegA family two-component response regulator